MLSVERGTSLRQIQREMENRRQHFRITYPSGDRPRFVYGTSISEVLECSERGVRIKPAGDPPVLNDQVTGRISMCHGAQVSVAGTVIWCGEGAFALHLDSSPIPFLAIIREQLFLRRLARQRIEAHKAAPRAS